MTWTFTLLAALTVASAVAAMGLRNLVHCALALVGTFVGLAALYLQLDAQFVGLAQILVYVGAVAILVVFAILLTRSGDPGKQAIVSAPWVFGLAVAAVVFATVAECIVSSEFTRKAPPPTPDATVQQIGTALMTTYVLPLEIVGLLLTAALIGAVLIAMRDRKSEVRSQKFEAGGEVAAPGTIGNRQSAIGNSP